MSSTLTSEQVRNGGERQCRAKWQKIKGDHMARYTFANAVLDGPLVLDAACGCGYGSAFLADCPNINQVLGVDIEPMAIEWADEYWKGDRPLRFIVGDIQEHDFRRDTDYEDMEFDSIVSFETIEHISNPEKALKNFCTMSGHLLLSVPNQEVVPFVKENNPHHYRHYTVEEINVLLRSTGWEPVKMWFQHECGFHFTRDTGEIILVEARAL